MVEDNDEKRYERRTIMIKVAKIYRVDGTMEHLSANALTWLYRQVLDQKSRIPSMNICLGIHQEIEIHLEDVISYEAFKNIIPKEVQNLLIGAEADQCNVISIVL